MALDDDMEVSPVPDEGVVNYRSTRFSGESQTCNINELSPRSLDDLRKLYRWLDTVGEYSLKDLSQPAVLGKLEALITRESVDRIVECARNVESLHKDSIRIARILHDLRRTAVNQIIGIADLWLAGHTANQVDLLRRVVAWVSLQALRW